MLSGLFAYRAQLRRAGIMDGFQWIDGSFVEDVEMLEGRPPNDADLVTFARRPSTVAAPSAWATFVQNNLVLFTPAAIKASMKCDAYYVDLDTPPHLIVSAAGYWYGLFSHRRSGAWKGMLCLPLQSDDIAAQALLTGATP